MVCKMVLKLTTVGIDGRDQSLNMGFVLTVGTTMRDDPTVMAPLSPPLTSAEMTSVGGGASIHAVATLVDGAMTMATLPPPPSQSTTTSDHTTSTRHRAEVGVVVAIESGDNGRVVPSNEGRGGGSGGDDG
jgi:hypothetical protein